MLVGWLRDRGGSYTNGFAVLMILGIIGIITVSLLPGNKNLNDPLEQKSIL
jgi:hypothetical protein